MIQLDIEFYLARVNSTCSQKSIRRKRFTTIDILDNYSTSTTSPAALNVIGHVAINNETPSVYILPEQSDDEVEINEAQTNTSVSTRKSRIATRSQWLVCFEEQTGGYKFRSCNKVNIPLKTVINIFFFLFMIYRNIFTALNETI